MLILKFFKINWQYLNKKIHPDLKIQNIESINNFDILKKLLKFEKWKNGIAKIWKTARS